MSAIVDDHHRRARRAYDRGAWAEACDAYAAADGPASLPADDLRRLAESAYLAGRDEVAEDAWTRAHRAFLEQGEIGAAVRCAFWLGLTLIVGHGDHVRGGGWIARARRLLDDAHLSDGAEHGYVQLTAGLRDLDGGEPHAAHATFVAAARIGDRLADADLSALARLGQGQALLRMGETAGGLELLDEVMVAVAAAPVSPLAVGIIYCAVIIACQQAQDLTRAQQWTGVLDAWCATQPELVPFRGQCLVHRSQLAQLRGDWSSAVTDADRACGALSDPSGPAGGMAHYQRGELHRLRGEHADAVAAYERAAERGHDPHPGLALLWAAQGRTEAAVAAINRVTAAADGSPGVSDELRSPRPRAELLAAQVEIMLAAGDVDAADAAGHELAALAAVTGTTMTDALAKHAGGAVLLARGQPQPALDLLLSARASWAALHADYEAARTRVLIARALRALDDDDTAAIEATAARRVFEAVGAVPDLGRLGVAPSSPVAPAAALTARELEVVRLMAAGRTNREIAAALVISDKTVARHLHNVFTKLDVPNRSAATAYAYEHHLVEPGYTG